MNLEKHIPSSNKDYHVYTDNELSDILIIGKNQLGNDFIIDNAPNIINNLINNDIHTEGIYARASSCQNSKLLQKRDLIWMHGNGPSPHFIFYSKNLENIDLVKLENFIKSKCPEKSDKSSSLDCCLLSNVIKTDIPGKVVIKSQKLSKVIKNMLSK